MRIPRYSIALFTGFIIAIHASAQIPQNYYQSAEDLFGEQLKSALHNIIKNHKEYPYTSSSTDVWDILKKTDKDTTNPDNVILFYTGWSVNAAQEYNDNTGWSREHIWAKSHGDFGTTMGAGTDAHHLRPADITVNSARNNKDFDNGGELYIDGDGATECYSDADSWQPRDAVKGDVARMLFYMAVRYEGENGEPDLELVDAVNTYDLNETGKGYMGKLSTLIEWNAQDPIDSFEINRNNVIYSFQGNRNPFIDHPEYVNEIWTVTSTHVNNEPQIKIYPNPARDYVNIELFNNKPAIGTVYNLSGEKIISFDITGNYKLSTIGIRSALYFLRITTEDRVFQFKLVIFKN